MHSESVLDLRSSLGLRIEELRTCLRLSREQFASRTGLDPRQIANYELYGTWPEPEKLTIIATGLKVTVRDLFDFSDTRSYPQIPLKERLSSRKRDAHKYKKLMPTSDTTSGIRRNSTRSA